MAQTVRVYVKKQLRLDLLSVPQRQMYQLGVAGLASIKRRVSNAYGGNDGPAPPLVNKRWMRIKKAKGLRPIRDLRGTGMMWPENAKAGKRKPKLKFVGHLMEQMAVRKISGDNRVFIDEPTSRYGRKKARNLRNRAMLGFSPSDKATIIRNARVLLRELKSRMVRAVGGGA